MQRKHKTSGDKMAVYTNTDKPTPKVKIRDSVFTDLFKNPEYTLQLYKALHSEDTDVTVDDIDIVTVENILLDKPYNDLGFTVKDKTVILVEAQTTMTENIIIRVLLYAAVTYNEYIFKTKQNIYGTKNVKIPEPEFYVLFTGESSYKPEMLSLSECFFNGKSTDIEVKAKMVYDSNDGDIINQYVNFCKIYTEQYKIYGRTKETIEKTIEICLNKGILRKYLSEREKEVMNIMSTLFEQDRITELYGNDCRQEGRQEQAKEMALELVTMGLPVEKIAQAAKVSVNLVKEWLSETSAATVN